eukprot:g32853.t1
MFAAVCQENFRKFDVNADGVLSWSEVLPLVNTLYEGFGLQPPREGNLRAFFDATDLNKERERPMRELLQSPHQDGVLSEQEFQRFFECFLRYAFFDVVQKDHKAQQQRQAQARSVTNSVVQNAPSSAACAVRQVGLQEARPPKGQKSFNEQLSNDRLRETAHTGLDRASGWVHSGKNILTYVMVCILMPCLNGMISGYCWSGLTLHYRAMGWPIARAGLGGSLGFMGRIFMQQVQLRLGFWAIIPLNFIHLIGVILGILYTDQEWAVCLEVVLLQSLDAAITIEGLAFDLQLLRHAECIAAARLCRRVEALVDARRSILDALRTRYRTDEPTEQDFRAGARHFRRRQLRNDRNGCPGERIGGLA